MTEDLPAFDRRRALRLLGGAGVVGLAAACSSSRSGSGAAASATSPSSSPASSTTSTLLAPSSTTSPAVVAADVSEIPDETAGPYPGDGSNGPNALGQDGIVRQDIRPSFGSYSGTAQGLPLAIRLRLVDVQNGAAPLAGAAVYLWHCDRDGGYSLYTAKDQDYLRGVQAADADGFVTFTSIFPGCYPGRWPHIHFEIYRDTAAATSAGSKLKTSQLALPQEACQAAYTADGYSQSAANLNKVSLSSDMVFRDGWTSELATVGGSNDAGYSASLVVGV